MEEKFDVIIVGGGPSGLTAGYFLAKAGLNVVILERGNELGNKSMFGGRIYTHALEKNFPGYKKEAPIERWVRKERIVVMDNERAFTAEFFADTAYKENSFTTYLTKFIQWLGSKAENEGALIATGVRVDSLIIKDGKVVGAKAGEDELYGDYIIIAEGANTLLLESSGLKRKTQPHEVAVGVKEVIRLDEETINNRFNIDTNEGVAAHFLGYASKGMIGGGFMYTMRNEVTLGVVVNLSEPSKAKIAVHEIAEEFRMHPYIKKLLDGGYMLEYSAHIIVEKGPLKENELYGDGYLVVGDAAGFELNTGFTVRGVDFAIESGKIAADTIIKAHEQGKNDRTTLSTYVKFLKDSFVLRELATFKKAPKFLLNKRIYTAYPGLILDFLSTIYKVDGTPRRIYDSFKKAKKNKVSLITLIRDLLGAVRSL